jgi:hypothetical protein
MAPGLIEYSTAPPTSPATTSPGCFLEPDHVPNFKRYRAKIAARLRDENRQKEVPSGWPALLEGPLCWDGTQLNNEELYVSSVSAEDKLEVEEALKHFKGWIPFVSIGLIYHSA